MKKGFMNLVAAVVMIASVTSAGVTNAASTSNGNDSKVNSYRMDVIGALPSVSTITLAEVPRSLFIDSANPTWNDTHPGASTSYSTLASSNLEAKYYHNINPYGIQGNYASIDQGSLASQALPAPEPETYSMLLAGLGLIGLSTRRRKTIR